MADTKTLMTTEDTLLAVSEWLDSQGLIAPDNHEETGASQDRTHAELAQQFVEHWESNPHRAVLAGRVMATFAGIVKELGESIAAASILPEDE